MVNCKYQMKSLVDSNSGISNVPTITTDIKSYFRPASLSYLPSLVGVFITWFWQSQRTCFYHLHQMLLSSCFSIVLAFTRCSFHHMILAFPTYLSFQHVPSFARVLLPWSCLLSLIAITMSMLGKELVANGCDRVPTAYKPYNSRSLPPPPPLPPRPPAPPLAAPGAPPSSPAGQKNGRLELKETRLPKKQLRRRRKRTRKKRRRGRPGGEVEKTESHTVNDPAILSTHWT